MPDTANPNAPSDNPMAQTMLPTHGMTEAIHIGESDLPFVQGRDGSTFQVQKVDLNQGLWIVRTRFQPGLTIEKHYHTGPVHAVTFDGAWYYKEYPEYVNRKGSFLFEPAHSVHTLTVAEDNEGLTDVWFAIWGANLQMDDAGNVTSVTDAQSILQAYRKLCEAGGLDCSKMIVIGE